MSRPALAAAFVLIAFLVTRPLRSAAFEHFISTQRYEDIYYLPPEGWLRIFSLGHREALADLLWMKALVYFGDEVKHRGGVAHALDYANAVLALDPDFKKVYHWAGTAGMYKPVERGRESSVTEQDVEAAIGILRRGAKRFPDDAEMAWDLGASLLFELVPMLEDPVTRERVRQEGVAQLQTAARLGGGPPWLALTNATQLQRLGKTEQAIRHLEEMYSLVKDEEVRQQIRTELAFYRDRSFAEALQRTWDAFERRRRIQAPYVPPDLFLFLDEPPAGLNSP